MSVEEEAAVVDNQTETIQACRAMGQTSAVAAVQAARLWNELSTTAMPPELITALVMQAAAHYWTYEFGHCSGHEESE